MVNAVQNGKLEKVSEFYEKLAPDLQHQAEWKDWFGKVDQSEFIFSLTQILVWCTRNDDGVYLQIFF